MNPAELLDQKLTEMGRKIERPSEGTVSIPADKIRMYATAPLEICGFPERLKEEDQREEPDIYKLAELIARDIPGTIAFIKPKEWAGGQGIEAEIFTHGGVQVQRLCGFDISAYRMISRLGVTCYSAEDSSSLDNQETSG